MRIICTICPIGCELNLIEENGEIKVSGNLCPQGEEYGREEFINPKRTLITVIPCRNGDLPVVSVKTDKPIPKNIIPKAMKILSNMVVDAPKEVGDVVLKNILNTGADVVITRRCSHLKKGKI